MANRVLLPSQEYLQERLKYNPKTGSLRWNRRPVTDFNDGPRLSASHACAIWNGRYADKEAGYTNTLRRPWDPTQTYKVKVLSLNKQGYVCSKIIYKMVTGLEPDYIDHKDTDPENNRWTNLRPATCSENGFNRIGRRDGAAGLKGVSVMAHRKANPYLAQIGVDGKITYLGTYATAEEAHAVYVEAATRLHGSFVRTKKPRVPG